MNEQIGVEITTERGAVVVAFKAPAISDVEQIATAAQRIRRFVDDNHPKAIVFDFGGVKFFSSRVLGLLLDIRARLHAHNGELLISGINPQLHRIFKITNLDKVFRFFPDRETAVKAVGRN